MPLTLEQREGEKDSSVNIRKSGNGYIIDVKDQYTENTLAVTKEELELIVLYGQAILKPLTSVQGEEETK